MTEPQQTAAPVQAEIDLLLSSLHRALAELNECGPQAPGLEDQVAGYRARLQELGVPREAQP